MHMYVVTDRIDVDTDRRKGCENWHSDLMAMLILQMHFEAWLWSAWCFLACRQTLVKEGLDHTYSWWLLSIPFPWGNVPVSLWPRPIWNWFCKLLALVLKSSVVQNMNYSEQLWTFVHFFSFSFFKLLSWRKLPLNYIFVCVLVSFYFHIALFYSSFLKKRTLKQRWNLTCCNKQPLG